MRRDEEGVGNHGRVGPPGAEPVGPVEARRVDSRQSVITVFQDRRKAVWLKGVESHDKTDGRCSCGLENDSAFL